ncbi:MAG: hypothetical protein AB7F59_03605 [Bdellovibrionales bacterium]
MIKMSVFSLCVLLVASYQSKADSCPNLSGHYRVIQIQYQENSPVETVQYSEHKVILQDGCEQVSISMADEQGRPILDGYATFKTNWTGQKMNFNWQTSHDGLSYKTSQSFFFENNLLVEEVKRNFADGRVQFNPKRRILLKLK